MGLVFLAGIGLTAYPPLKLCKQLWCLFKQGDSLIGLLAVSMVFLFIGFIIDDILRPAHWVMAGTKQLCEETSEGIGALFYFIAMILHWRIPLAARSEDSCRVPGASA